MSENPISIQEFGDHTPLSDEMIALMKPVSEFGKFTISSKTKPSHTPIAKMRRMLPSDVCAIVLPVVFW